MLVANILAPELFPSFVVLSQKFDTGGLREEG